MKKVILSFIALMLSISCCFADELRLDKETKYQKQVMEIGYRILNANQIEKRMTFYYAPTKTVNAATYLRSKQIAIFKGLVPFFDSDDELAAVLCHEIAHGIDAHKGFWKRISMSSMSKTYEYQADLRGVDLMVNAGYNPVAMIIILNKITDEPNWFERNASHPEGSRRLIAVYDYIYSKYPEYLIDNEYKNNVYYQNFLLTSKNERKKIREKYTPSNTTPVNYKKNK